MGRHFVRVTELLREVTERLRERYGAKYGKDVILTKYNVTVTFETKQT